MIKYFYTGADDYLGAQIDKDKSLGGFVSSSEVPNDLVGSLFGEISSYTIDNDFRETKAIVIKNETGGDITGITTYFNNTATSPYLKIEIASVALTEDTSCTPSKFSMEKIVNSKASPVNAVFAEPTSSGTAVGLGNLTANSMLGIWIRVSLKSDIKDNFSRGKEELPVTLLPIAKNYGINSLTFCSTIFLCTSVSPFLIVENISSNIFSFMIFFKF